MVLHELVSKRNHVSIDHFFSTLKCLGVDVPLADDGLVCRLFAGQSFLSQLALLVLPQFVVELDRAFELEDLSRDALQVLYVLCVLFQTVLTDVHTEYPRQQLLAVLVFTAGKLNGIF